MPPPPPDPTPPHPPVHMCRAYEPRFGTEDNPISVPSLLGELTLMWHEWA
jgi:hypothetical protein